MATKRYKAYEPEEEIVIAGGKLSILEAMNMYRPIFYLHGDIDYMKPDQLFCDAIHSGDSLIINYYLKWPDERHPIMPIHILYRIYRSYYYGSPADIEFIQLGVNLANGDITTLAFERDPHKNPFAIIPKHERVTAHRTSAAAQFHVYIAGDRVVPRNFDFEGGKRLKILVSTWNHTYDFYNGKGVLLKDTPLVPLTDELYDKYYMERRSRPPGV